MPLFSYYPAIIIAPIFINVVLFAFWSRGSIRNKSVSIPDNVGISYVHTVPSLDPTYGTMPGMLLFLFVCMF